MATFLCVTASVALLAGLVGLVGGHVPRTMGRKEDPCVSVASWSAKRANAREHY
jgi:hypothetical protein